MLFCTKFSDFKESLLDRIAYNLDLRPNTEDTFNILSRLVNQLSLIETKAVCTYISQALKIRQYCWTFDCIHIAFEMLLIVCCYNVW